MCEATRWDCENMGGCAPPSACVGVGKISHPRAEVERAQGPQVEHRGRGGAVERLSYYHEGVVHAQRHGVVWQPYIGLELNGEIPSYCLHARDLGRYTRAAGRPRHSAQPEADEQDARALAEPAASMDPNVGPMMEPLGGHTQDNGSASDAFPLHALGETYGVLAYRVYEHLLPADEIAHISRHMQALNLHLDPESAGHHEPTSAPTFPYGPVKGRDSSRSRPKKMSDSHPLVPILIQPTEDGEPAGQDAGGDDHQDDGVDDDEDELPDPEPQDFDALGAFLRTPAPSISQTQGDSSAGPSTSTQHRRPREDEDEDDDENAGAQPLFVGKPSSELARNKSSRTTWPGSTHPLLGC
ncbi:uncharacterized protein G2W53_008129 [Senna tora]|uniref:Uncharacterized protein n=1 Tax=Senna tora TaxID=362788 RepID=A0A834X7U8_9FABA|nr:uncharacterized protein G2W53_008129 [Senna tora]